MNHEPHAPARIIVVDDDRLIREMVRDAIRDRARVESCESAEQALEALDRQPADLVISDLTMPGISGVSLLERIRREHPGTDFVLLTGNASVESAVGALRMGAADYLSKPIRSEELALVVDRILARRRLLEENERLRDALSTVDACRTLVRCLDPGEVYALALDLLLGTMPSERGLALFRRSSVPLADNVAVRGFSEDETRLLRHILLDEKAVDLETMGALGILTDSTLHEAMRRHDLEPGPMLLVPIRGRQEAGAIWLLQDEQPFDPARLERAELIAGHAELAIQNAERYHNAKEKAFIDDVTEVYNARFLLQQSEREIQRAERYAKPLSVLFLDLDRFKRVNDEHGHLVGSAVLRRLSQVLRECIRQVDTLARYGGDEFTILLVDTAAADAVSIAERIRRTVAETLFEGDRGAPIRLTISIGVAAYPAHATRRDPLLDLADKAMYRAKSRGRNCVCSADDLGE